MKTNETDGCENELISYLECVEQKLANDSNNLGLLTLTFHIVYSSSFNVPVLYLNVNKANGSLLNYQEIYDYFNLSLKSSERGLNVSDELVLTQQEHPILFKPFYFIHPCQTSKWMQASSLASPSDTHLVYNYTLKWLSFVFSAFGLDLNTKYGLRLEELLQKMN